MWILTGLSLVLLGICTVTDIRKREISGSLMILFALLTMLYRGALGKWWLGYTELFLRFLPGAFFLLVHVIKRRWIGAGDGLLVLVCGYAAGAEQIMMTVWFAFALSGLYGLVMLLTKKRKGKDTLPFAPVLLLGMTAAVCVQLFIRSDILSDGRLLP